jgi:peptidoglycan/LPS O-acetylase OafA/YrhL
MGSLGPTQLIALLLVVAVIASIAGFIASAATGRNRRHARRFLVLGFFCGLTAGAILRGRRRGVKRLARRAFTATAFVTRMRENLSPRR